MGNILVKLIPNSGFSVSVFPPTSTFDATRDLPDLSDHIVIVTGGNTGIGLETCLQLLRKNCTVYLGARSPAKAKDAIDYLNSPAGAGGKGKVIFLEMDLNDLRSVKKAAEEFLRKENRLDVLVNNAGIMMCPLEWKTEQGYDYQFGVNVIAHHLFTKLLTPALLNSKSFTGKPARIVNLSSSAHAQADPITPIDYETLKDGAHRNEMIKKWTSRTFYGQSKLGNLYLARHEAVSHPGQIISPAVHPGFISTGLQKHMPAFVQTLITPILHPPSEGALTTLWAGFVGAEEVLNGQYCIPWARVGRASEAGRAGVKEVERLVRWLDGEVKEYLG